MFPICRMHPHSDSNRVIITFVHVSLAVCTYGKSKWNTAGYFLMLMAYVIPHCKLLLTFCIWWVQYLMKMMILNSLAWIWISVFINMPILIHIWMAFSGSRISQKMLNEYTAKCNTLHNTRDSEIGI